MKLTRIFSWDFWGVPIEYIRVMGLPYWLRGLIPGKIKRFYWDRVRCFFFPQHSELRAAIPRTWTDLDDCIENFLYAAVISFVEKEDGINSWQNQDKGRDDRTQAPMLKEVYKWAKTGRHDAQKKMMDVLMEVYPSGKNGLRKGLYEKRTKKEEERSIRYRSLEVEFDKKDNQYLLWIVEYRGFMWT